MRVEPGPPDATPFVPDPASVEPAEARGRTLADEFAPRTAEPEPPTSAASLTIAVVDPEGEPVPGAEIELTSLDRASPRARVHADGDGRSPELELVAGAYAVSIEHGDYSPRRISRVVLDASEVRTIRAQLSPGWRLQGRVETAEGTPVPGATLVAGPACEWKSGLAPEAWKRRAVSDAQGAFTLDGLPMEPILVSAHEGDACGQTAVLEPTPSIVVILLEPGLLVRGLLLEAGSREPVDAGELLDVEDGRVLARSDAEGRFAWTAPLGDHGPWTARSAQHVSTSVRLDPRDDNVVSLPRRVNVAFIVHDAEGGPLEGVNVHLLSALDRMPSGVPWQATLRSDGYGTAEGRPDVPRGIYRISLQHDELGLVSVPDSELLDGDEPTRIRVSFPAGGNVTGVVYGPGGTPLPGATVLAIRVPTDGEPAFGRRADARTRSRGDGTFALRLGAPGAWLVRFEKSGFFSCSRELHIGDHEPVQHLEQVLLPGVPLRGIVTDLHGDPVSGASAWIADPTRMEEVLTDEAGRFTCTWSTADPCLLQVWAPGYASQLLQDVPGDGDPVQILLEPCGRIRGLVLARADDLPIGQFDVRFERADGERDALSLALATMTLSVRSKDGRFVLEELRPGPWNLEIIARGYAPWKGTAVCSVEPTAEQVVAHLGESSRIEGTVLDRTTGAPLSGALVEVSELSTPENVGSNRVKPGRLIASTRTDGAGHFELTGLSAGEYRLQVERDGFVVDHRRATVGGTAWSALVLRFELLPSVSFFGTVFDAEGRSVAGATVFVQGNTSHGARLFEIVQSDEQGRYRLEGVERGRTFHITAHKTGRDGVELRHERKLTIQDDGQEVSLVME
jgi:protocatechuate 3,4-dioxygenase beta subunit